MSEVVDVAGGQISRERAGEGPDLILLHSLLTDRHAFQPVLPALARHWRVNSVDLPGFGASSAVGPSIDAYADAIGSLLEAGGYEPRTTALVGNGFGAFVALGTAIRHGHRFDRLVLVGAGTGFPPEGKAAFSTMEEKVAGGGLEAVVDVAVGRIFPAAFLAAHPAAAAERRAVLTRTRPDSFITACRALHDVDYAEAAARVTNPTLIVVGSEDGATPPALARQVHAAIPAAELIELEGVGHTPHLQDPDGFLAAVGPFLSLGSEAPRGRGDN